MNLLVVNDDGIHAEGIRVLAKTLSMEHEVTVAAPVLECSATSHHTTMFTPMKVIEAQIPGVDVPCYAVYGMPADCVKVALTHMLQIKPDLVISGINCGANVGTDIIYSGTVAAAMEGVLAGCKSIAISVASHFPQEYETAASFALSLVNRCESLDFDDRSMLNVNVPNMSMPCIKGIKVVPMGVNRYSDRYEEHLDAFGKKYYWLKGEPLEDPYNEKGTDVKWLHDGYITISPLWYDLTNDHFLEKLRHIHF
jgi:5'-nucleotidase